MFIRGEVHISNFVFNGGAKSRMGKGACSINNSICSTMYNTQLLA